jgi:hypothetical protein
VVIEKRSDSHFAHKGVDEEGFNDVEYFWRKRQMLENKAPFGHGRKVFYVVGVHSYKIKSGERLVTR